MLVSPSRLFVVSLASVFLYIAGAWLIYTGTQGVPALGGVLIAAGIFAVVCFLRQRAVWKQVDRLGQLDVTAYESPERSGLARFYTFANGHAVPAVHCRSNDTIVRISGAFFTSPPPDSPAYDHKELVELDCAEVESSSTHSGASTAVSSIHWLPTKFQH